MVSDTISRLIRPAPPDETRIRASRRSFQECQPPRVPKTKPSMCTCSILSNLAFSSAPNVFSHCGSRRLVRHDYVGSQGREILTHAWDSLINPEIAWEPGRSKSLNNVVVPHVSRSGVRSAKNCINIKYTVYIDTYTLYINYKFALLQPMLPTGTIPQWVSTISPTGAASWPLCLW